MGEKRLTKEIAEQFLADEESVDISEFTKLDDDAEESLSKHVGGHLSLDGLTNLSVAVADRLSKYKGLLHLNGLVLQIVRSVLDEPVVERDDERGGLSLFAGGPTAQEPPNLNLTNPNGVQHTASIAFGIQDSHPV